MRAPAPRPDNQATPDMLATLGKSHRREQTTFNHEVLSANVAYTESFGDKAALALRPARRFAVLTCMDARLDPAKSVGLSEGDAHVIPIDGYLFDVKTGGLVEVPEATRAGTAVDVRS